MSSNTIECNPGLSCNNGNEIDCCVSKVTCKKPRCLDDLSTECIFVEKVFDARLSENETQFSTTLDFLNVQPTDLVSIETFNIECNVLSVPTTILGVNINDEFIDISTTIPGPGGDQVVLNREQLKKIQDINCAKDGKGTEAQLDLQLNLSVNFEAIVTGTGIDSNGQLVPYTASTQLIIVVRFVLSFKDFCIPTLSLFPISLISSCLVDCTFVTFSLQFFPDFNQLNLTGQIIFCSTCETLLKVPSQLCALTTGPCKIKKSKSFCDDDDFPSVFWGQNS